MNYCKYYKECECDCTGTDDKVECCAVYNLKQENERLKVELKSQQMINLKQQDIALDYWNALEEIRGLNLFSLNNSREKIAKINKIVSEVLK